MNLILALLFMQGAMDDASAMVRAKAIWGTAAEIAMVRTNGDTYWTKRVGCHDPNFGFQPAGAALNTWDAAFATVDMTQNGPQPNGSFKCTSGDIVISASAASPVVGSSFTMQLTAKGGGVNPIYSWNISAGALPDGLAFDPMTATVTGTPAKSQTFSVTFSVSSGAFFSTYNWIGGASLQTPGDYVLGPFYPQLIVGQPARLTFTTVANGGSSAISYSVEDADGLIYAAVAPFVLIPGAPNTQSFPVPRKGLLIKYHSTAQ